MVSPSPSPSPPSDATLFAPVDAIPILTSGRNSSSYGSGHQPKYTLDNNPDTWWASDTYADNSVYYDLGSNVPVDTIVIWLHNYNENYADNKSWRVFYSLDDITYVSLGIKDFSTYRIAYTPLVVDDFGVTVSARYWRIEFLNFDAVPQTILPQVSCVWFMNDYSLPWKHQRPESNKLIYHNNSVVTRSGHRFASPAGLGKQRVIQRQFVFTDSVGQWNNLKAAYDATRGRNLPLVLRTELGSDEYYAVQFEAPLVESRQEHELWSPIVTLRELGHKRIPYTDRSVIVSSHGTVGLYHFRGNALDDSGSENDLTLGGGSVTYNAGFTEHGTTEVIFGPAATFQNTSGDFNFGTNDFSIELWCKHSVDAFNRVMKKSDSGTPNEGWEIAVAATNKSHFLIGDGTAEVTCITNGTSLSDGGWHHVVWTIDRDSDEVRIYIDGVLDSASPHDISSITGSVNATNNFSIYAINSFFSMDEIALHTGVLTAVEVLKRYNGRVNYGSWGM